MSDVLVNTDPKGGEEVAQKYIEKELAESRKSLTRTRIVGGVFMIFTIGYMSYLTSGFRNSLEPVGAAQIATGLASQRLDDLEPKFADYLHEQVPQMIRKAPDEIISHMPEYRKHLEDRVESDFRAQAMRGSDELSKNLDSFLSLHKDEVAILIKDGQDPTATEQMGLQLEDQFKTFLHQTRVGDTTIEDKLGETLSALKDIQGRTAHLAKNKGLAPSEVSVRHAIAMLMRRIGHTPMPRVDASGMTETIGGMTGTGK